MPLFLDLPEVNFALKLEVDPDRGRGLISIAVGDSQGLDRKAVKESPAQAITDDEYLGLCYMYVTETSGLVN